MNQNEYDCIVELQRISRRLHRMGESYCNYPRSDVGEKQFETRQKNLMFKATELAHRLGLNAYHQEDPRGCSLYLVTDEQKKTGQYNQGVAIWL